jgi:pyruvate/2-oxoglutarate dehydrogenase complex dihydrolipoamide acyltransferase (E2) component
MSSQNSRTIRTIESTIQRAHRASPAAIITPKLNLNAFPFCARRYSSAAMPQVALVMPQLGESIAEATVIKLLVNPGDEVHSDQEVMEVETSKATTTVNSPCSGRLSRIFAEVNEAYPVGAELGTIEVTEDVARSMGFTQKPGLPDAPSTPPAPQRKAPESAPQKVEPTVRGLPVPVNSSGASYMSPRMKARMQDLGLHASDLAGIAGSGAGGRVTIQDFEKFVSNLEKNKLTQASSMRVAVADAMRRSWTRPLATVALPVTLDPLLAHRNNLSPKPGPALYALRALALALGENSAPAGRLVGNVIAHPPSIDIGFAVEADDGVLVPVVRNADQKPLQELVARYNELVTLARARRLSPDATGGSIATVTNFGTFGLTWATPIPLPEQTLVLGMGAGRKVPSWDEETQRFLPITEANLTLSFDHRVLDGGAAGRLLARIAALMTNPSTL